MSLEGILPVWKPAGFTSHDVVAKVRRMVRERRIGHTGTLDPQVTGVLPLCIGRATRMVEYIQELPKQYEALLTVGYSTDTEDSTGNITDSVEKVELHEQIVKETMHSFIGQIEQIPPMFSALKVDGKRLYELARQGVEIERQPRKVTVFQMDILEMNLDLQHPQIRFRVLCSKGTYIRTLCTDIGKVLGYPTVMSELVRTATGHFTSANCLRFEEIEQLMQEGNLASRIIPADQAISHIPSVVLNDVEASKALQGQKLALINIPDQTENNNGLLRAYALDDRFLGIFRYDHELQRLIAEKVFT